MSVRPLDLQVNMNSMIETSRDLASRQANVTQEQRGMDHHMIDDSILSQHTVNKTDKAAANEKLEDTERHFGNRTEAETEQQNSSDDREQKKTSAEDLPKSEEEKDGKKKKTSTDHMVDYLV